MMKSILSFLLATFLSTVITSSIFAAGNHSGTVLETMNAGGYTYILLEENSQQLWMAGPETTLATGDQVVTDSGMLMKNFESKTLDRVFPEILFVSSIMPQGTNPHATQMPEIGQSHQHNQIRDVGNIEKATGGYTVQQLYTSVDQLLGQQVRVRGKVVKFTPQVMGTNWVHIQDGSGDEVTGDLTITTDTNVKVDDIITVEGVLQKDKDLGYGYFFPLIIERASISR